MLKQRRRQRGAAQYEHRDEDTFAEVGEDGMRYLVNLTGYVDTGLFIDQRLTRRLVRRLAAGRRFLNLFAYTGTMTVNALAGGAPASTTVDLSGTYLDWAGRNLAANGFAFADAGPHRLVRADVLDWIGSAEGGYDLVWLDPPTFSNSRRMGHVTFDVQRDHADLVRMVARRLLAPGGTLLFATNRRGFTLERDELPGLHVRDLSRATLAPDCARAANRHHVFEVRARAGVSRPVPAAPRRARGNTSRPTRHDVGCSYEHHAQGPGGVVWQRAGTGLQGCAPGALTPPATGSHRGCGGMPDPAAPPPFPAGGGASGVAARAAG